MTERDTGADHPPRKVGVREFRANFADFMRQVRHGASFAITSRDVVVAIVHPPRPKRRRQPGTLRGRIEMAPDFDVVSPELLAALEGEEA